MSSLQLDGVMAYFALIIRALDVLDVDQREAFESACRHSEKGLFSGAQMDFSNIDLRDADLSQSELRALCLNGANLAGADLTEAILSNVSLHGATLAEADLSEAKLDNANLSDAGLQEAQLYAADFTKAKLEHANLLKSILDGADVSDVHLGCAEYDGSTRWPDGFMPP